MADQSRFLNNHQYLECKTLSFYQNFLSESDYIYENDEKLSAFSRNKS